MRKIKFRVWSKEDNRFYFPDTFRCVEGELGWESTDYVLQQCIGIEDGQGNEIYEGDIIFNTYYGHGIVQYFSDHCRYIVSLFEATPEGVASYDLTSLHERLVVGNIFEL